MDSWQQNYVLPMITNTRQKSEAAHLEACSPLLEARLLQRSGNGGVTAGTRGVQVLAHGAGEHHGVLRHEREAAAQVSPMEAMSMPSSTMLPSATSTILCKRRASGYFTGVSDEKRAACSREVTHR